MKARPHVALLLLLAAPALALAACSADTSTPDPTPRPSETADINGTWTATGVPSDAPAGFADAVLTVTADEFALTVGCNDLGGVITVSESTIMLTSRSTTEIGGCPAGEDVLWEALESGVVATIHGANGIELELPDGVLQFEKEVG